MDIGKQLPMWTEIHIQPLDVHDMENSRVYWIKHPQIKQSVYDKDLETAIKEFMELWDGIKKGTVEEFCKWTKIVRGATGTTFYDTGCGKTGYSGNIDLGICHCGKKIKEVK